MKQDRPLAALAQDWTCEDLDEAAAKELEDSRRHPDELGGAPRAWFALVLLLTLPVRLIAPLALAGAVLLLGLASNLLEIAGGLVLIAVAVVSRPKTATSFEIASKATAKEAPRLFAALEATRRAVGGPRVHEVWWGTGTTAATLVHGWRRRRVVAIGAPLWVALGPQARVALLAHQIDHFRRPELRAGRWTRNTLLTLDAWWFSLGGGRLVHDESARVFSRSRFFPRLLSPLRAAITAYCHKIVHAQAPLTERGEHLADEVAASVAGRAGALQMLDVLLSETTLHTAVSRASLAHGDPVEAIRAAMAQLPEDALAARRESARRTRVDGDHPATPLRYRLVALRGATAPPAVVLAPSDSEAIDAESRDDLVTALTLAADYARSRPDVGLRVPEPRTSHD
jgi:hypothetical protein